jgi:hypothetical protein
MRIAHSSHSVGLEQKPRARPPPRAARRKPDLDAGGAANDATRASPGPSSLDRRKRTRRPTWLTGRVPGGEPHAPPQRHSENARGLGGVHLQGFPAPGASGRRWSRRTHRGIPGPPNQTRSPIAAQRLPPVACRCSPARTSGSPARAEQRTDEPRTAGRPAATGRPPSPAPGAPLPTRDHPHRVDVRVAARSPRAKNRVNRVEAKPWRLRAEFRVVALQPDPATTSWSEAVGPPPGYPGVGGQQVPVRPRAVVRGVAVPVASRHTRTSSAAVRP